jgi:glycosyltransferase involved in cell wall biosynthesis
MYRLGYDAKRLFNNFTGLGNYSRTLLRDLAAFYPDNAYFLYSPRLVKNQETQFFINSPLFNVETPPPGRRLLWRTTGIRRELNRHRVQLYHGLSHEIPIGLNARKTPSVVTIHDLIFYHYPHQYRWADRQLYDFKFRYACQHATRIVAISEATKQDIIRFYGIPEEKISVIYQSSLYTSDFFRKNRKRRWMPSSASTSSPATTCFL